MLTLPTHPLAPTLLTLAVTLALPHPLALTLSPSPSRLRTLAPPSPRQVLKRSGLDDAEGAGATEATDGAAALDARRARTQHDPSPEPRRQTSPDGMDARESCASSDDASPNPVAPNPGKRASTGCGSSTATSSTSCYDRAGHLHGCD